MSARRSQRDGGSVAIRKRALVSPVNLERICSALEMRYGNPRHGNKRNPLDELVFILLSTRTREATYRATYRALRASYPSWEGVSRSSTSRISTILAPGGLSRLKARQIVAIVRHLKRQFGHATLAPLHRMEDEDAEAFLISLPGVAKKVAKCVLMYALDRKVLPVDAHVHRVAGRLGLRVKRRPDTSQDLIEAAIPANLRYGFHVNAIALGRDLCLPDNPRCSNCPVQKLCHFGRSRGRLKK